MIVLLGCLLVDVLWMLVFECGCLLCDYCISVVWFGAVFVYFVVFVLSLFAVWLVFVVCVGSGVV